MLRLCGAELDGGARGSPTAIPENYVHVSERVAAELRREPSPTAPLWANQWDNLANCRAHITKPPAPRSGARPAARIDGFICAIGTGGTLAGTGIVRSRSGASDIVIGLADPMGAAMYSYFTTGELVSEGSSITEGIGQGRVTGNVAEIKLDEAFQIPDEEALPVLFDLLKHEGLCLGPSTGINVAGAIRLARKLGPGHTIVTILADGGQRYQSKLFNPTFLKEKNLPAPDWL